MNKKKCFDLMFLTLLIMTSCFVLISCKKSDLEFYSESISEARYNYYFGEITGYEMSLTCGVRETDFRLDGYHTENIEFGVITIKIPTDIEFNNNATYRLDYGNKTTSGTLEQNPFDMSLMADIGFVIDEDSVKITFKMDNIVKVLTLNNVTTNFNYNYISAFELFIKENSKGLKEFVDDGEFKAEVYIKIIHDNTIDSGYYFLIRVIGRNGKVLSGIVNPITGEILAVTNSKI